MAWDSLEEEYILGAAEMNTQETRDTKEITDTPETTDTTDSETGECEQILGRIADTLKDLADNGDILGA